jgi:hypothetical protein
VSGAVYSTRYIVLAYIQVLQVIYMIVYVCIFDREVRIGSPRRRPAHTRAPGPRRVGQPHARGSADASPWRPHTALPLGVPARGGLQFCLSRRATPQHCGSGARRPPPTARRPSVHPRAHAHPRAPTCAHVRPRARAATLQLALTCSRKLPPNLTASIFAVAGYSWRMTWGFTTRLCTIRRPRPRTCSS